MRFGNGRSLTTSSFVAATYLKATGEVSTLTSSDDDWNKILGIANLFIDEWASEPGADWRSLYSTVSLAGTVTATDTFALGTTIRKVSNQEGDFVRILHTNGTTYTDYQLVAPERLKYYSTGAYCAQEGSNLVFNAAFKTTDLQYGGTIKVPAYLFASHLASSSDLVPVDDPNWLVVVTAAEWSRTDITRQNQYSNLIAEANNLMAGMKLANNPQVTEVFRAPTSTPNGSTW